MSRAAAVVRRAPAARRQRGLSLVTALLFMVATLILGVSVMSINVMQERMIGNTKDRDLALQAAEAALRDAERYTRDSVVATTVFNDDCAGGLCTPPSQRAGGVYPSPLPVYNASLGFSWSAADGKTRGYGQDTGAAAYPGVAAQPRYVVEKLGQLSQAPGSGSLEARRVAYRITVRAVGARADTVALLQSIYVKR